MNVEAFLPPKMLLSQVHPCSVQLFVSLYLHSKVPSLSEQYACTRSTVAENVAT